MLRVFAYKQNADGEFKVRRWVCDVLPGETHTNAIERAATGNGERRLIPNYYGKGKPALLVGGNRLYTVKEAD